MDVCGCREEVDQERCRRRRQRRGSSKVVLDFQSFKDDNNEFVVKEATVIDVTTGTVLFHRLAHPPYDRSLLSEAKRRENRWLTKRYHGLEWNVGDTPYVETIDKLRACLDGRSTVYVKGLEKKRFVENNLITYSGTSVIDMSDLGCGSLNAVTCSSPGTFRCARHGSADMRCALANCTSLRGWLLRTDDEEDDVTNSPHMCSVFLCVHCPPS